MEFILASNWKTGIDDYNEAIKWIKNVSFFVKNNDFKLRKARVIAAVPYPFLGLNTDFDLEIFSQNLSHVGRGAYTGEVTINMLKSMKIKGSIVGHSERRHIFAETNELINKKVLLLQENEMDIILCIGETLEEKRSGQAYKVLYSQVTEALKGFHKFENLIIAYEPVWAIGTGIPISIEDLKEMESFIRDVFKKDYRIENIRLLYGGSVNKDFVNEIKENTTINGVLVGSASWKSEEFIKIIENFVN